MGYDLKTLEMIHLLLVKRGLEVRAENVESLTAEAIKKLYAAEFIANGNVKCDYCGTTCSHDTIHTHTQKYHKGKPMKLRGKTCA